MRLPDLRQSEPPHPLIEKVKSKERLTPADTLREHRDTAKKHVEKSTKEKKKELVDKIKEYRLHHAAVALETHEHEALNELQTEAEKELGVVPVGPPGEVSDIAVAKPEHEKSAWERIKEGFMEYGGGALVKAYIAFRRMWSEFWGSNDADQKQLNGLEKLYGKFFGAAELQQSASEYLRGTAISIQKGVQDGIGYAQLKADYAVKLGEKLKDKAADVQEAIRASFPFEKYVQEKVEEYAKKCKDGLASGKKYVTTLSGILKNEKPKEAIAAA